MELYIVRHGQSTNNVSMMYDNADREVDPPLTELGQQQALAVAKYFGEGFNIDTWVEQKPDEREVLRGIGITQLYCSPMLRTLQTCQPISHALGLPPKVWIDIHEHGGMFLSYPDDRGLVGFPGMKRSEMLAGFPDYEIPDVIAEEGWWNPNRGYEDISECQGRAIRVMKHLEMQAGSAQRIALVTHGTFADCLVKAFLNLLPSEDLRFFHYNTAITRIDLRIDGKKILRYTNRTTHLQPEMVS